MKKLSKKYNYSIPKYNLGGLKWGANGQGTAQGIASLAGMAAPLLGEGSRGAGALSGAASGAAMGAALGPIGMGVGAVLGGTIGLISAGKAKRAEEEAAKQMLLNTSKTYGDQFNSQLDTNNQGAYGNIQFAEGGDINKNIKSSDDIRRGKQFQFLADNILKLQYSDKGGQKMANNSAGYSTFLPANQQRAIDSTNYVNALKLAELNPNKPITMPKFYGNAMNNIQSFAMGSDVLNPNIINIEKGELQIDPNSGKIIREYTGINPETGGLYEPHKVKGQDTKNNLVSAEEGTFIITKAKAKEYKDAIKNNDKLHLESIKMNIRNNKDAKLGSYKMGSYVKYNDGSKVLNNPFKTQGELRAFQQANGLNPDGIYGINTDKIYNSTLNSSYATPIDLKMINPFNSKLPASLPITQQQAVTTGIKPSNFTSNVNNLVNTVSQYGPSLMNIGRGLFGNVETQNRVQAQVNPFQSQVLNNMPEEVSYQPLVNELNRNLQTGFRRIDNTTSGSPIARANKNAMLSTYQDKLSKIRLDTALANNQIRGQRGSIYNQLGQQQVANNLQAENMNLQIDQINAANRGAKQNLLSTGLGQLQQTYQNNQRNNQLYDIDMYKAELLKEMFPNLGFYDIYSNNRLKQLGGR